VLELTFTDQELSPAAASDDLELAAAQTKQQLSGFTATIDGDKQIIGGTVFSPAFTRIHQFASVGTQKADLTAITPTHVAGSVAMAKPDNFFEEKFQYTATFDLPVSKPAGPAPPPALNGTRLPAGGGDPGKAYMVYLKAFSSGDTKGFLAGITAARAKEASSDPDFKKVLPLLQGMQPTGIEVIGGAVDGTTATLLATGKDNNHLTDGVITMFNEGGAWKVESEEWKTRNE